MDATEDIPVPERRLVVRGPNKGKELDRMSRGGRLHLKIPTGKTRPANPVLAAKFATECGLAVRSQAPIFTHWKEYKENPQVVADFQGTVSVRFPT